MPKAERSRNWIFTLNNPNVDQCGGLVVVGSKYLVYQKERGAEGTEHLQGLVCFSILKSLSQVRSLLPRAHLEIMRGSLQQAIDYATKEDTRVAGPWSTGERPKGTVPPPGEWNIARRR